MPLSIETDESLVVPEAVGPPIPLGQAGAAMAMGVVALLLAGVVPVLLGALADEGRLSAAGIGQCATYEGLAMGIFTALASAHIGRWPWWKPASERGLQLRCWRKKVAVRPLARSAQALS